VNFGEDTNNTLDTGFGYANAALGVFDQYLHLSHLRIVIGWRHMRREELQLSCFALIVEDVNGCQPARLCRTVQFAQVAERLLARAIRCAHRFDK
jgi:hypothetical protein